MIHGYDMTTALAEQHRSQLKAEAARHRLVRDARRAQRAGDRPILHHRLARAVNVLRLAVALPKGRHRLATNTEATLRAVHAEQPEALTTNMTADLAQLVVAPSDGLRSHPVRVTLTHDPSTITSGR